MNGINLSDATALYLGANAIAEVYCGTQKIWPSGGIDYSTKYLTIENTTGQTCYIDTNKSSYEARIDGGTWQSYTSSSYPMFESTIELRCPATNSNDSWSYDPWSHNTINVRYTSDDTNAPFSVYGNSKSLVFGENFLSETSNVLTNNAFYELFASTGVTYCEHMIIDFYTVGNDAMHDMFAFTSITKTPNLSSIRIIQANGLWGAFYGCSSLTNVSNFNVTSLSSYALAYSFGSCYSLVNAPSFNQTITYIQQSDWQWTFAEMFKDCTSLVHAIPAITTDPLTTSFPGRCFLNMYQNCSSLVDCTALTGKIGESYCFEGMYKGCSSLRTFNSSAIWGNVTYFSGINTFMSTYSYSGLTSIDMGPLIAIFTNSSGTQIGLYNATFQGVCEYCSSLTNLTSYSGQLPIAIYGDAVFYHAFYHCGSLTNHMTTPSSSYQTTYYEMYAYSGVSSVNFNNIGACSGYQAQYQMFIGCTNLTTITGTFTGDIGGESCKNIFADCTSLTNVNFTIKADTVGSYGMEGFIRRCPNLTDASNIHFESITPNGQMTLSSSAMYAFFSGCSSITKAPILDNNINPSGYHALEWMYSGNSSLNYVKMYIHPISDTGIFYGWLNGVAATGTVELYDNTVSLPTNTRDGIPTGWNVAYAQNTEYLTIVSKSDNNVIGWAADDANIIKTISVSTDDGNTWTPYTSSTSFPGTTLSSLNTGDKLLIKGNNSAYGAQIGNNLIGNIFTSTGDFDVEGNIMSLLYGDNFVGQTTLNSNCTFYNLFGTCTHLISAAHLILPATTLREYCYYAMFGNCISLTTAPVLPATTLAKSCYGNMFWNCISLTTAPVLPATTLASHCYAYMFEGCTSLTTAPVLPATTLATGCYSSMFWGCTSLNYIKCLATDISAGFCTSNWVKNVAASGTFVKDANMSSWTTGNNGIPSGWTTQNAS